MAVKSEETWPVVHIDGTELRATSEVHYRKLLALQHFMETLLDSPAREHVAKVMLFGSVAWGDPEPDSDVDVLVFGLEPLASLDEMCAEASLEAALTTSESVRPLVYPLSRYTHVGTLFMHRAIREGKELYTMDEKILWRETAEIYYDLASDYLEGAQENLEASRLRIAIDSAYNAAELCAKAFLTLNRGWVPKRHGGIITAFSDEFVKTGIFPRRVRRALNRAFEYCNKARYEGRAPITREMATSVLDLAQELVTGLEKHLRQYLIEEMNVDEQKNHP